MNAKDIFQYNRHAPTYDPSVIDEPGMAVLRRPGSEVLGRIPYVTYPLRTAVIADLAARYPRHPKPVERPPKTPAVSTVPEANIGLADQWRELLDKLLLQQLAEKQPEKRPESAETFPLDLTDFSPSESVLDISRMNYTPLSSR